MSNITQVVGNDKNMTTLNEGVLASNLDQLLSGSGPFTVYALSEPIFHKQEGGKVESLIKPEHKVKLTELL